MTYLYELAVLGAPTTEQREELRQIVSAMVEPFGLHLGNDIRWETQKRHFRPAERRAAAAVFFGDVNAPADGLAYLLEHAVPVLPVVPEGAPAHQMLPASLWPFNWLVYDAAGAQRIATALLECAGLLPRQRRVFLSYRRAEARAAALQLFDALSQRVVDVFMDTHGIAPAEDFQAVLWHRLCDADVLVMLDTPTYFESRWTAAEFGRALAKGISVLRVGWPDFTPSVRTATVSRVELLAVEIDPTTGRLDEDAVERICWQLEAVRSQSHAVRQLNLFSNLRNAVERIGGTVAGVGPNRAIHIRLPTSREVTIYPTVGVPTSTTLHDAAVNGADSSVAVLYDHIGLHASWLRHLDWLGSHIDQVRWVKMSEAAWDLADWQA